MLEQVREQVTQVREAKGKLGRDLLILTHHYQRSEIVELGDKSGDSFVLAREAAGSDASHIVFCGVHFMAESASVLSRPGQRVFMPDPRAGCPMADMADLADVHGAVGFLEERLSGLGRSLVPVAYINSSADVKALVGRLGGITCTSSSAKQAVAWASRDGACVLFLPDEFLGRNTAHALGFESPLLWNPHAPEGGLGDADLSQARMVVWKGYCHVHTWFTVDKVNAARARYPGARLVVHPECQPEVVDLADASGSTAFIVDFVERSGPGSTTLVGTEINLVRRLAALHRDRTVLPLDHSLCPNMYRTTLAKLAHAVETFDPALEVRVEPGVAADARLALDRMLELARDRSVPERSSGQ